MSAVSSLFLLGALSLFGLVQGQTSDIESLKSVALALSTPLSCDTMNCDCAFNSERGCCCGANEMFQTENDIFMRMKDIHSKLHPLTQAVQDLTTNRKVAFQARMRNYTAAGQCYGPFNIDVPIPFNDVLLNDNNQYNKALGIFTAPCNGIYVFSFTIASSVQATELLYHKVELIAEGVAVVAVWENNREDFEDSATQYANLQLNKGNQVYLRLISGRKICTTFNATMFGGFLLYPL